MKKEQSILKRVWVMLSTVLYLFIAVSYILFLPKYHPLRNANNFVHINTHSALNPKHHAERSYGSILVLVHQAYRSTIETKRVEINSGLSQTIFILGISSMGGLILMSLLRKPDSYLNSHKYTNRYAYLSYCTLRI